MSEIILHKVRQYLSSPDMLEDKDRLEAFARRASNALEKQFSGRDDRLFRLRMSNLGRPGCVLQSEALGVKREPAPYSARFRNLYGDLVEAAALAIMKNAGVRVIGEQVPLQLELAGIKIDGTADVFIDEGQMEVYDVKSASNYAFSNKYLNKNLQSLWDEGDTFGYVTQIYLYSEASGLPVGGLITINKENGEWAIVPPPLVDDTLRKQALKRAEDNVRRILNQEEFRRDFEDEPELYRGKPTGNQVLNFACVYCSFRDACWPDAVLTPQVVSKGKSPKLIYYTKIAEEYGKRDSE